MQRMKALLYSAGIVGSFALGLVVGRVRGPDVHDPAAAARPVPAYLVASWDILSPPEELKPFAEAAVPLAAKAGLRILADSKPRLLEGQWPYKGVLIVQEYTSMQALVDFWDSADHVAAKKLREGRIDSHFVVAVEALH